MTPGAPEAPGLQTPLLSASGLRKQYAGREVVAGVDLVLGAGEVVGLLGPNGAGKTTCFRLVLGFESADAGIVRWQDHDISAEPAHRRARRGLGYLPQDPSVFQGLRTWENVAVALEGLTGSRRPDTDLETHARKLLGDFGLSTVADTRAGSLSGGERRRLELARALAAEPQALLLDEPFAAVDPKGVDELQRMIGALRARGIGVLLTDHRVVEALRVCDRAYVIDSGRVLRHGTPDEIVNDPAVRAAYLGDGFHRSMRW